MHGRHPIPFVIDDVGVGAISVVHLLLDNCVSDTDIPEDHRPLLEYGFLAKVELPVPQTAHRFFKRALFRSRGFPSAAIVFGESMASGVHRLESPTAADLELALKLGKRYKDSGAVLPDLIAMSMAHHRKAQILTWDFRHFRSVVLKRGHHRPLPVSETEMPPP